MNSKRSGGRGRCGAAAIVPAAMAMLLAMLGLSANGQGAPAKATAPFPGDGDVVLVLSNATWWSGKPGEPRDVALRLQRLNGAWDPVVVGHTLRGQNASHYGFIAERAAEPEGERLKIRLYVRPDRWIGGEGHNAYTLRLRLDGAACSGSWTGIVQGVRAAGAVSGIWEPVHPLPGYVPPVRGERPRLLIRKSDLPGLRERIGTPEGKATLAALKANNSVVAQAFAYAMTGDAACGQRVVAALDGPCNPQRGWWHHTGGDQHGPAIRIVEHLIAYDLAYDLCTSEMHKGLRESIADNLDLYYWGALNSQFNPNDTSNWSLLYRSALGLMGLTLLDAPPDAPTDAGEPAATTASPFPKLTPPAGFAPGNDVPVARWAADNKQSLGPWLFAGPVAERNRDDALASAGGLGAVRPGVGAHAGELTFRRLKEAEYKDGNIDLATLTERKPYVGCYFYTVLDIPQAGYYRLATSGMKGTRFQRIYIAGCAMERGDHVHLAPGRYPLAARVWTEPVGGWEPLMLSVRFESATEEAAMAWQAGRDSVAAADAECGRGWQQRLTRQTGRNLQAWAYARMAAYRAEKYFMLGLGDGGWDQEGGYTRHAMHLAMPFAHCFRNTFGRDIRGADRAGKFLMLAAARTIFTDGGMISQNYSSGGGPMDLTLLARGFSFVPEPWRPGLLWTWKRSDALAAAGKYTDVHAVSGSYDALSTVMRFLSVPPGAVEKNPAEVMPRVYLDNQKGGYVFRNRWQDGDDFVVQLCANSGQPGGTWASAEAGVFRIAGLGVPWAVRGEGYGQGTARERLDSSQFIGIVDVAEQNLPGPSDAQASVTHVVAKEDGSGVVSLDMTPVYRHQPRTATVNAKARPNRVLGEVLPTIRSGGELTDLGIKAVRSFAVDYSGAAGAPCLVAVADRLTGTNGDNTWVFVTDRANTVTCDRNAFVITAPGGATLRGTVVRPAKTTICVAEHAYVQEINYRGSHAHRRFDTKLIQVAGQDRDQDFLVVMTIQKGDAPAVSVSGAGASAIGTAGKRSVGFDGRKIVFGPP